VAASVERIKVVFEPDGATWLVRAPAVPGCQSWGRNIDEARANLREALATCDDVFEDAEAVAGRAVLVEEFRLPASVRRAVRLAQQRSAAERSAAAAAADARLAAAHQLREAGVSLHDAGVFLNLSKARVHQLLAAARHAVPAARRRSSAAGGR
jgi:predicted RNase H-like HicB family nuclease